MGLHLAVSVLANGISYRGGKIRLNATGQIGIKRWLFS